MARINLTDRLIASEKRVPASGRANYHDAVVPGLGNAQSIRAAAAVLVEAGWLIAPRIGFGEASRVVYRVNPRVFELAS